MRLRKEWLAFFKIYINFWSVVAEIEIMNYAASYHLEKLIIHQKRTINKKQVSQLVAPPQKSYLLEEKYELLKIANIKTKVKRELALSKHISRFFWILNGYHGLGLANESFFVNV